MYLPLAVASALLCGWASAARAEPAEVVIAVVESSRAGLEKSPASPMRRGVEAALARIGSLPPLAGRRVRVIHEDDRCVGAEGAAVAGRLLTGRPSVIIGHGCSSPAIAAAAIYANAGLLFLSVGARHPDLTNRTPRAGVLRFAGRDDHQPAEIAAHIARTHAGRRIAVIFDRSAFGQRMGTAIQREIARHSSAQVGAPAPLAIPYFSGEPSYPKLVQHLVSTKVEVLVFSAQTTEASIIVAGLREATGMAPVVFGSDVLAAGQPPPRLLENAAKVVVFLPAGPHPGAARETLERSAEAALEAWAAASRRAGSLAPGAVGSALRTGAAATAIGPVGFTPGGDLDRPSYAPHVWHEGRWMPAREP